jgi:hypothetical protein
MRDAMKNSGLIGIAGFMAGALGTAVALRLVPGAFETVFPSAGDGGHALIAAEVGSCLASATVGVLTSIIAVVWVRRRSRVSGEATPWSPRRFLLDRPIRSAIMALVLLAYAVTWAGGAPAATNMFVRETLRRFEGAPGCQSPDPRVQTVLTLPVVPSVVLAWQEAQMGGHCGWGGWKLYFWSGGEPTELYSVTRWLS